MPLSAMHQCGIFVAEIKTQSRSTIIGRSHHRLSKNGITSPIQLIFYSEFMMNLLIHKTARESKIAACVTLLWTTIFDLLCAGKIFLYLSLVYRVGFIGFQ